MYDLEVEDIHQFVVNGFVCHNCQGITLDTPVVIHAWQRRRGSICGVSAGSGRGWLYVACSRVTSRDLLYFDTEIPGAANLLMGSIHTDPDAVEFYQSL